MKTTPCYLRNGIWLALLGWASLAQAAVTVIEGPDLAVFFNQSISPAQDAYDPEAGGSTWVTGAENPLGGTGALRFTDQSAFVPARIVATVEPVTTQFRISLRAYNNVYVEGGTRGARLRFGANAVGLITTEARVAATVTFKQDNNIQAKGDLPDSPSILIAQPIQLQTPYDVDIIVNVHREQSYTYQYRGTELTLAPAAYHVMVDGVLLPGMPASGLPFALTAGNQYADYTATAGGIVEQIGFVSATADVGVDWYFADMVFATGEDIPIVYGPGKWGPWDIVNGEYVDTGDTLGWIYIGFAPWLWVYDLGKWIYGPEEFISVNGIWVYIPR